MYCEFFGLRDYPFLSTADRRFFYLSHAQAQAKEYLGYLLVIRDGIVVMTGEPGVGKSVLLDQAITDLTDDVFVAQLQHTSLRDDEFLFAVCRQFDCLPEHINKATLFNAIRDFAMDQHLSMRPVLLVIDEAHNLNAQVLEEILGRKLIQVVLMGQPELGMKLSALPSDNFSQLVRLNHQLMPLSREEISEYIDYRLYVAGNDGRIVFPKELLDGIICYTGGIPRLINQLCDMMLVTAYINKTMTIDNRCLHSAIHKLAWPIYIGRKSDMPQQTITQDDIAIRPLPLLVVRKRDVIIGKYLLNRKRMLIGRQKNLDICIDEVKSSRIHAQLVYLDQQFFIHDLNSHNGTYLSDQRIKWYALSDMDKLRIGEHTLEYQLSELEQAATLDSEQSLDIPMAIA